MTLCTYVWLWDYVVSRRSVKTLQVLGFGVAEAGAASESSDVAVGGTNSPIGAVMPIVPAAGEAGGVPMTREAGIEGFQLRLG